MDEKPRIEPTSDGWRLIIDRLSIALPNAEGETPYEAWMIPDLVAFFSERTDDPLRRAEPPIPPPRSQTVIQLPPPQMPASISFFDVLERRRTLYQYGAPMTLDRLSLLLFYSARVKGYLYGTDYDTTVRPYPSAGAAYELEIYALSASCDGLDAGFYHYRADAHAFERLELPDTHHRMMVEEAIRLTGHQIEGVQVALYFTARMRRINWKKRALALAYQDVGVLIQTLYLTAAALELAPCALGGVDPLRFSEMTAIPLNEEPLLSGFLVGSDGRDA